ncbi:phage tail sheath family protein [Serinicoccus sediminis]|uniref:phage tail sheath family protein n=1 Tax=Serinicoccus sediminis TaxID=2306021 RepID=UPI0013ED72CA|nr:phage tail sheath C-terminal domain-containing protein [Serinicoccus sediminis]
MPDYSTRAPGVYLEEVSGVRPISGVGTALPAFLGLAPKGPTVPTYVANWTQFEEMFGGIQPGLSLGRAVYSYIANGGSGTMVVRTGGEDEIGPAAARAVLSDGSGGQALIMTARQPGEAGNAIRVEVSGGPAPEETSEPAPHDAGGDEDTQDTEDVPGPSSPNVDAPFDMTVTGPGGTAEHYTGVTAESLLQQLQTSALVAVSAPEGRPVGRPSDSSTTLQGGSSGTEVGADAFIGDAEARTGLAGLVTEDEVTMVAAPDLVTALAAGSMTKTAVTAVQRAMIEHCEALHDRMAIIDPPLFVEGSSAETPMTTQQYLEWRDGLPSSKFAATYCPWVTVLDLASGQEVAEPPSGFVAGVWARNDAEHGVASAPSGRLRNTLSLTRQFTDADQGRLNPRGVNCLRVFRGQGPVVYGVRTLSDDTEWRYLNVRRLFNYIEESVMEGTQFAVFAPNDTDLWARLRRSVSAFLLTLWRDGALVGTTPEEAFYVRCDAETNPRDLIDQGVVTVEIGAAPVKPAEFVVIRVRQSSDGSAVSE